MEWINLLGTVHSRAFDMPWLAYFAWWTEKLAKQTSDGAKGESEYGTRNHLNSIIAVLANISTGKKLNSQFVKSKYLRPRRLLNTLLRKLAFPPGNEACLISSPILFICFILYSIFTDWVVRKVKSYQVRHWIEPKGINVVQIVVRQVQRRQFGQVLKGIWLHRVQSIVAYVQRFQTITTLAF